MDPRLVLLNEIDASQLAIAETFRKAIGAKDAVTRIDHNTLAVSQSRSTEYQTQVAVRDDSPWRMKSHCSRNKRLPVKRCVAK